MRLASGGPKAQLMTACITNDFASRADCGKRTARIVELKHTMNMVKPMLDLATHYQIEVQGQVAVEWLQSFDSSAEINVAETRQMENITVLHVHTDQSGMVGLVRRLHGLRITILQLRIVSDEGNAIQVENPLRTDALRTGMLSI